MTGVERGKELKDADWLGAGKMLSSRLVWLTGLASTIYLVGSASFLAFLALVFVPSPSENFTVLDGARLVAMNALPACVYAMIGITGLTLWPSSRLWILGLSAILGETALAIYACAVPGSIPLFTDWLL